MLFARFRGTMLLAPPPAAAAAAAAVGCLGPARRSGNVLYSSWESVVLSLYGSNHRENNEKNYSVARFRGTLLLAPAAAAAAAAVGCLSPASNVLYSSWESVVLRLCAAVIREHSN